MSWQGEKTMVLLKNLNSMMEEGGMVLYLQVGDGVTLSLEASLSSHDKCDKHV